MRNSKGGEMMTYFEGEIKPLLKGIQTFKDNNNNLWVQYDIKHLKGKDVSKVYNYLKSKYKEVYPNIQKFNNGFIGDIQFLDVYAK
jgi:hypothetical protein